MERGRWLVSLMFIQSTSSYILGQYSGAHHCHPAHLSAHPRHRDTLELVGGWHLRGAHSCKSPLRTPLAVLLREHAIVTMFLTMLGKTKHKPNATDNETALVWSIYI